MNKKVYFETLLPNVPRILSQINASIGSRTFGCGDRCHWHNSVTAIPNARYQEAVLTLALLYKHGPAEYRDNPLILRLINGMIGFWTKIQESDGSFNEWYVHEGSYVATAFSSYAVSQTLLLLDQELIENRARAIACLKAASAWLGRHSQKSVCNQQSGALIAIHNTHTLTGDPQFKTSAEQYEQLIASCQTPEGWFLEYGGPDIGYLSLTIDYLAKYQRATGSPVIADVLKKAVSFLVNFIHADGTAGGPYTSRETEYLIPHGFELLATKNEHAAFAASVIRKNLAEARGITPFSLDDRYLMYNGYTFLQAGLDGVEDLSRTDLNRPAFLHYPLAGIAIWRRGQLECVANLKKLGAFAALAGEEKIADSGVLVEGERRLYSGYLQNDVKIARVDENGFSVEGPLCFLSENIMTPFRQTILNLAQLVIGRSDKLKIFVKEILRKKLITGHKPSTVILKRTVTMDDDAMRVEDRLEGLKTFKRVIVGGRLSFIYVPSSRLFQAEHLTEKNPQALTMDHFTSDPFVVQRRFNLSQRNSPAGLKV